MTRDTQTVTQDSSNNQVKPRGYRLPDTDGAKVLPTSNQVGLYLAGIHQIAPPEHTSHKQACYSFIDPRRMKGWVGPMGFRRGPEIRPSAETPSTSHWRRFYFQLTRVHSALELSGWCTLQIYLLTYQPIPAYQPWSGERQLVAAIQGFRPS